MKTGIARLRRLAGSLARGTDPDFAALTPDDRRYLTSLYDDRVPLPEGGEHELSGSSPRLDNLRERYAKLALPVLDASRWHTGAVDSFLDLRYFRGETLFLWHYREPRRASELKYFIFTRYVADRDELGLLERLREDGAFGCWTFSYEGHGRVSRDLLESANEISFLERELRLSQRDRFSVLDIGAGYGRLAHRMAEAYPQVHDYCCVDAIPEATFLSEYYLRYRGCIPPARVAPLDALDRELRPGSFDLAVNVHGFSEWTHAAVAWWIDLLRRLEVPLLLVVPNEPTELLTLEPDGSRRDFAALLAAAGYRLARRVPVIEDPAVRELLRLRDHFHLFRLGDDG
jgi:SAM-dependent methyltransferase